MADSVLFQAVFFDFFRGDRHHDRLGWESRPGRPLPRRIEILLVGATVPVAMIVVLREQRHSPPCYGAEPVLNTRESGGETLLCNVRAC